MLSSTVAYILAPLLALAGAAKHVDVMASYAAPEKKGASPAVIVSLLPLEPDIRVNEDPAPRLKLDATQKILVYEPPKKASGAFPDPDNPRYLDPQIPVRFEVGLAEGAPQGSHAVKATVTYFYCSKRQGWCRKGTKDVELAVSVP